MSKERRRRRAERERQAALLAAERTAEAERRARREARRRAIASLLPQRHSRQTGPLAERRRNQAGVTFAVLVALNLLVFALVPEWSWRALVFVVSLLAAPVLHTMLFRRS